ncbi:MAG: ATP-binding protein [Alphaproteobacteria bacterium]|nr:ATP-binding protein [Alphaproteobacteria bacterium]
MSSALWIIVTLVATGLLIVFLFKGHIERRFDHQLVDHLEELVAASEVNIHNKSVLNWIPADPRFNRPHSGWYWEILSNNEFVHQSNSLLTTRLLPFSGDGSIKAFSQIQGPSNQVLRIHSRIIRLPKNAIPYVFSVAGPVSDINRDIWKFAESIVIVMTILAISLIGIVVLQIRFGLKPLRRVRENLLDIKLGNKNKLPTDFPSEIQPLATDLNALLEYQAALLNRARTQVGNLAHSLKNPMAVLKNELKEIPGEKGLAIRAELDTASQSIDRYLQRARIAGAQNVLGVRADLKSVSEDIIFSLDKLYAKRKLDIHLENLNALILRVDPEDLIELLGNLMDNACKWATSQVKITATRVEDRAVIIIEDDGLGLPAEKYEEIMRRGTRFDETKPGSGLGLDIVAETVELYGGELAFSASKMGGLHVKLVLPLAIG